MRRGDRVRSILRDARRRLSSYEHDPLHKAFPSACYAPNSSMYFDQHGNVRACCQNTGVLMGNVREQSIREIWESDATRTLRTALRHGDYSQGCGFCKWQIDQGDGDIVFAKLYDALPVESEHPEWPTRMEFAMTNSCNLQCIMCNGDWSSSIRAHREHRPALPAVYHDEFFDELADFLPHLRLVNFAGGEPFLGSEPLRVMEMLAELDAPPHVGVITNGTQWNTRVERLCERLEIDFVLSLDGITPATYESIRIGSDFGNVMKNLDRMIEITDANDMHTSITHCLMRPNAHEFARLLRFAEERDLEVAVNKVLFPAELSLFQMSASGLRDVIESMEHDQAADVERLDRHRPVWDAQLDALRHRLAALEEGTSVLVRPWLPEGEDQPWVEQATDVLTEWVGTDPPTRLLVDRSGRATVEADERRLVDALGLDLDRENRPEALVERLAAELDDDVRSSGTAGMLYDVVLGEDVPGEHPLQFRVAWSGDPDQATVLVAVRNPHRIRRSGSRSAELA